MVHISSLSLGITIIRLSFPVVVLQLREAIEAELRQSGLQVNAFTLTKVIQLYETKNSRHSTMLVGKTGSGKSVTWRTLQKALTTLHQKGVPDYELVQVGVDGQEHAVIYRFLKLKLLLFPALHFILLSFYLFVFMFTSCSLFPHCAFCISISGASPLSRSHYLSLSVFLFTACLPF